MGSMVIIENLAADVTESALTELLSQHGTVRAVQLAKDETAEGAAQVAFVTMRSNRHGHAVIAALNGRTHSDRVLKVRAMKRKGELSGGPSATGGIGLSSAGRGGRGGIFGGKGGAYGHKGRGKNSGRNR